MKNLAFYLLLGFAVFGANITGCGKGNLQSELISGIERFDPAPGNDFGTQEDVDSFVAKLRKSGIALDFLRTEYEQGNVNRRYTALFFMKESGFLPSKVQLKQWAIQEKQMKDTDKSIQSKIQLMIEGN